MPSLKHKFQSVIPDGGDANVVRPSNWNDEHDLLQSSGFLLGRVSASVGPTEELSPAQILTFINFITQTDARIAAAVGVSVQGWTAILQATTASYTAAKDTKLSGIATGATANQTDAFLLARANHTGTQLAATISDFSTAADLRIPAAIHAATSKATPVDADELGLADSAASFALKRLTWANVKAGILAYFNGTAKGTPIDADRVWQGDSTTSNTPVYSTWTQVKAFLKTYFDTLYVGVGTYTAADVLTKIKTVDGTGSGLDADLHDGFDTATAATVNTVAVRDASGDITTRLFRTEWASAGGTGAFFLTQNAIGSGVDNYSRPMDLATVKTTLGVVLSKAYTSAQQTITSAGPLTLAHGLGVKPTLVQVFLVCTTAELGYSINDEQAMSPSNQSLVSDATNVNVRYSSSANCYSLFHKTTGVLTAATNASWKLVVRAWAP